MNRVGQNHTFIGIYGVHTVFLAGRSPCIRCKYTVLAAPSHDQGGYHGVLIVHTALSVEQVYNSLKNRTPFFNDRAA